MADEQIEMPEEQESKGGIPFVWILIGGAVLYYILTRKGKPERHPV